MASDHDLDPVRAHAFDLTADPATVLAPAEQRIVDVNDAFLRVTGYDRDEVVGKRTADLHLWVDRDLIGRILEELRNGHPVSRVAVELRTRHGTVRVLRGSAELVEADGTEYVLAMGEDVSDDLARTDELDRSNRALADERRRLSARLDVAVGEERARIGRELHESTLQHLTVATLRLYLLNENLAPEDLAGAQRLGEALDAATRSTRAMVSELRRPVQEQIGLAAAIELAVDELARRKTVTHEVRDRLTGPLPVDVATIAHGMVREILAFLETNVDASRIEVELAERDGGLLATIFDDGTTDPHAWRHTVLDAIRHRLRPIGGRVDASASPGPGMTLELWIPIEARDTRTDEEV
jgi:PAS domain S-box-containing protein